MKNNKLVITIVILVTGLVSCSPKMQFTQAIKEQHRLTENEMQKIQFYLSNDIVMQRGESAGTEKETTAGELVIKSGNSVEQVVIKAGTPGVVIKELEDNKVAVRFEPGDGKYLVFGDPQNRKGSYTLIADGDAGNKKYVNYGGKKYILSGTSAYVSLDFKMRMLNQFKRDQRVVKGMKL